MPSAPKRSISRDVFTTFGIFPPREFLKTAILFTFTLSFVIKSLSLRYKMLQKRAIDVPKLAIFAQIA